MHQSLCSALTFAAAYRPEREERPPSVTGSASVDTCRWYDVKVVLGQVRRSALDLGQTRGCTVPVAKFLDPGARQRPRRGRRRRELRLIAATRPGVQVRLSCRSVLTSGLLFLHSFSWLASIKVVQGQR